MSRDYFSLRDFPNIGKFDRTRVLEFDEYQGTEDYYDFREEY